MGNVSPAGGGSRTREVETPASDGAKPGRVPATTGGDEGAAPAPAARAPSAQVGESSWAGFVHDAAAAGLEGSLAAKLGGPKSEEAATRGEQQAFLGALEARAQSPGAFHAALKDVYGANYDAGKVEQLRQRALARDPSLLPANIHFVDPGDIRGASGAYAPVDGGTVLLSRDLLAGDPAELTSVFFEEAGHHFDALLQQPGDRLAKVLAGDRGVSLSDAKDAAGDEGQRLSGFLRSGRVPPQTATDDKGHVKGLGDVEFHTVARDETARIVFHETVNFTHPSWKTTSLRDAFTGDTLDLNKVTPDMFKQLGPTNRRIFMEILGDFDLDVERYNGAGSLTTGGIIFGRTSEENGATAFARKMWASGDSEAFAMAFAANPDRITPFLSGNGARVLTAENMALIMREMRGSDGSYKPSELNALGDVVGKYLEYNAGKDPQAAKRAVEQLLVAVKSSGLPYSPENAGVVSGAVVAGMLKHFENVKASDELRNNIVGGVADAIGTVVGNLGPWGVAAAVTLGAMKNLYTAGPGKPRDFAEWANRLQGAIQLEWMQNPPASWSRDDRQDAITWVGTTILNNGRR